jgi:hypothetical protein
MISIARCKHCLGEMQAIVDNEIGLEVQCPWCGKLSVVSADKKPYDGTDHRNPIRALAERGYRGGNPKLEAVDRRLAKEYEQEFALQQLETTRSWWSRQDQTAKIFIGLGALMLLFFLCLWITNALRVQQERQAVEALGREAREGAQQAAEEIRRLMPTPPR